VDVVRDAGRLAVIRPPLKWAGGKRWLVPHLFKIWQAHRWRRLVEPFCGGLAIAIGLRPEHAFLNDINPHAINFYGWLKRGLRVDPEIVFENTPDRYYLQRSRFNALIKTHRATTAKAASLFYYLNRTGYNGLCRFNSNGEFNVPFGRYSHIVYTRDFTQYRKAFASWEFACADFEATPVERSDFLYADPPYDVDFTKYSKEDFDWDDQVRLAHWLARQRVPVVVSNQATSRIVELYEALGFTISLLRAPRMISCTGDRTPAVEVLATKNL
jgi:DNA adenine methylase